VVSKSFKYQIPALVVAVGLMVLCTMPNIDSKISLDLNDKIAHLLGFFPLAFCILWGFGKQKRENFSLRKAVIAAFLIAWLYGGLIEIIQGTLVPTRFGEVLDFIADGVGAILGIGLYLAVRKTPLASRL
jgi:VanZ family protein